MSFLTKRPNGFWNIVEPTSSGKRRYMSTKTKSKQEANSILGNYLKNNKPDLNRKYFLRDLEKWSSEYNKTDFGFFKERRLGNQNWVYVNKIFSQCLLTPKNIRNIPKIFWQARVAPNSIITEKQLLRIIELYGQSHGGFEKRVITLVNDENNPLRKVIIDIIRREYIKWKGYVLEYEGDNTSTPKSGWVYSTLLSAFNLNRVEESLNLFYYLFSQNDFFCFN